jgi:hypothetical protein
MEREFAYSQWKHLFGDQGLSDFDKEFESQKIRDEFGGTYQPMRISNFKIKDGFSFYDFINERELYWRGYSSDSPNWNKLEEEPIESRYEGGSPYESTIRNCSNRNQRIELPRRAELSLFLQRIDSFGRLDYNDFIAYYKPFHFHENWGIYLFVDRITEMARKKWEQIRLQHPDLPEGYVYDMVYYKTYFHEIYHHKIEMLATKLEFAIRAPVFGDKVYKFYCGTWGTDYCLEEAFANVYGARRCASFLKGKYKVSEARSISIMQDYLLKNAGKGYRVAYEILSMSKSEIEYFENHFIEMLVSYSIEELNGNRPMDINPELYDLFTYKLDPRLNFKNRVTFLMPY